MGVAVEKEASSRGAFMPAETEKDAEVYLAALIFPVSTRQN